MIEPESITLIKSCRMRLVRKILKEKYRLKFFQVVNVRLEDKLLLLDHLGFSVVRHQVFVKLYSIHMFVLEPMCFILE